MEYLFKTDEHKEANTLINALNMRSALIDYWNLIKDNTRLSSQFIEILEENGIDILMLESEML